MAPFRRRTGLIKQHAQKYASPPYRSILVASAFATAGPRVPWPFTYQVPIIKWCFILADVVEVKLRAFVRNVEVIAQNLWVALAYMQDASP